ncbi:translation termination inhibitor protein itt1 [Serendipita sp. 411]|nr:translation termination inhibitor protein itt1 [Serendipita sp. 411]
MSPNEILVECATLRLDEWTVLSSVYPEYLSASSNVNEQTMGETGPITLRFEVPVELENQSVEIVRGLGDNRHDCPNPAGPSSQAESSISLSLSRLPPLIFSLLLPPTYPLQATPLLTNIHALHGWLSPVELSKMQQLLLEVWEEDLEQKSGTLWRTSEWIRNGSFLKDLGLTTSEDTIRIIHPLPSSLAQRLTDNDAMVETQLFSEMKFDCSICLESIRGSKCIRLACKHVFCRPCLTDFWSLHVTEGDVDRVMCAHEECVKANRPITEGEVLRVLTEKETQRWKAIKRKRALEQDPGLVYCPLAFCQSPCPTPLDQRERNTQGKVDESDDVAMRRNHISLRSCDECGYSFCILCKRSWHGIAPCSSDITAKFLDEYMALEDGSPGKVALERRFGKAQLMKLVNKLQEDVENDKWLKRSTTSCPKCSTAVEKSIGCNHVSLLTLWNTYAGVGTNLLPISDDMLPLLDPLLLSMWNTLGC